MFQDKGATVLLFITLLMTIILHFPFSLLALFVKFSLIHNKTYLTFASAESGFGLCRWRGLSGFSECLKIAAADTRYIQTVGTSKGTYFVTTNNKGLEIYEGVFEGKYLRHL